MAENKTKEQKVSPRIDKNSGYLGEPIFEPPKESTYYDDTVDRQCSVPVRGREELIRELNLENSLN